MSAGNLIGSFFNTVFFGGLAIVMGYALEKVFKAFNSSISVLPTLQDAANGMTVVQTLWTIIFFFIFVVIWANYLMNENSQSSGGV